MAIAAGNFYGFFKGLIFVVILSILGSIGCFIFMRIFKNCLPEKIKTSVIWLKRKL